MTTDGRREARERFEAQLLDELTRRKLITREGREQALSQQVVMGGQITTNLWELGLVDGGILTALSTSLLHIREPEPKELDAISPSVLRLLPAQVAERLRILPTVMARSVLRVATCEPWDHLALGEAAQLTGYPLEPTFVSEVPLVRLLSLYYILPLPARFRLEHPNPYISHLPSDEVPWGELPELSEDVATMVVQPAPPPLIRVPDSPLPVEAPPSFTPLANLGEATRLLDAADDRLAVAVVLARFALSRGKRVVLLVHRGREWGGWLGAGEGIDPDRLKHLIVPAEPHTAFGLVSSSGAHYIGRLRHHPVHVDFLSVLGKQWPGTVALLPVHFRGKLVMGIYLDNGLSDVPTDLGELLLLAQRAPMVLERLLARRMAAIA